MDELRVPRQGERLWGLGNSGTGKTTTINSIFKAIDHGIFIDTKQNEDSASLVWNNPKRVIEGDAIYDIGPGRYVWRPDKTFPFNEREQERFFTWALEVGNRVIYIDEFGDVTFSANQYPRALRMCVTRGRSARLSIWGTTQEPIRVPSFLFGQAEHRYVFFLGHPEQQKLASQYLGEKVDFSTIPEQYDDLGNRLGSPFYYRDPQGILHGPTKLRANPTQILERTA